MLECCNHYRPNVGLDCQMGLSYPQDTYGEIQEISLLGSLLNGYRRVKQVE